MDPLSSLDPLSLLIIGGGLFANHYANSQALERQQKLQGAMQAYQVQKARETQAAIGKSLEPQTPQARADELANITASRANSMQSTMDAARAASPVTQVAGTNTSSDYQASQAAAADRVASRDKRMIAALATMGAPGEQAVSSGIRFGRTAGTVDANNAAIGNVGNAYMRDINNVKPNPWLILGSQAAVGAGLGMRDVAGEKWASDAAVDASVNNGAGYEDAAGNLYGPVTREEARQDLSIQRQLRMNRAMGLWGYGGK